MAHLIYYKNERQEYGELYEKKFNSIEETEIVFEKLARHFKLKTNYAGTFLGTFLCWTSGRNHPKAFNSGKVILNENFNSWINLCHELAHVWQYKKYKKMGHNKKHQRLTRRIFAYCQKKNWFEEEIRRRTAPKLPKPEPSKEELRQKEIENLQEKIKKYESKIKLYSNKLKKAKKKLKRKQQK